MNHLREIYRWVVDRWLWMKWFSWMAVCLALVSGAAQVQQDSMLIPKAEKKTESRTETYTSIQISCPKGYEAHLVDANQALVMEDGRIIGWMPGGVMAAEKGQFAVCFKSDFIRKIFSNDDLQVVKPKSNISW